MQPLPRLLRGFLPSRVGRRHSWTARPLRQPAQRCDIRASAIVKLSIRVTQTRVYAHRKDQPPLYFTLDAHLQDAVVESVTGISFPTRIKTPLGSFGKSDEVRGLLACSACLQPSVGIDVRSINTLQVLAGTAVRCMMGMCQWQRARAYAVGLYVQEPLAEKFRSSPERAAAPGDNGASARKMLMADAEGSRRLVLIMNQDGARAAALMPPHCCADGNSFVVVVFVVPFLEAGPHD